MNLSEAAAALGRKGGSAKTKAKKRAARTNGKFGGRPKKLNAHAECPHRKSILVRTESGRGFKRQRRSCVDCQEEFLTAAVFQQK